jgi:fluoroacetyl-CoA thioesterase
VRTIPSGTKGSFALDVSAEHSANRFKDATLPVVLATPVMIMAMENAALAAIKPYFEAGETAVGTHVDVSHVAATPVGGRIVAYAEVTSVVGRHVQFQVMPRMASRRSAAARTGAPSSIWPGSPSNSRRSPLDRPARSRGAVPQWRHRRCSACRSAR